MRTRLDFLREPAGGALPPVTWLVALAGALALTAAFNWTFGLAFLLLLLTQTLKPLDFFVSYLLLVSAASFVDYTRGTLTPQLAVLSVVIVFMLVAFGWNMRSEWLTIRRAPLLLPLVLYLGLSAINAIRGLLIGNSLKYGGLEVIAVCALGSALLVAAVPLTRRQLTIGALWLVALGLGHLALGLYIHSLVGVRTGMLSFTPVPGVIGMIILNLALRAERRRHALLWCLALVPMVVHQFISFTRGYWIALATATLFSVIVYVGRGSGAMYRLQRTLGLAVAMVVAAIVLTIVTAYSLGIQDIGTQAADRLASSVSTEIGYEAGSNFVRLSEYLQVSRHIAEAPWFGHGLGFHFVVREPFSRKLLEQAFMHQNYLYVWLKQGLIGLVFFVWMLFAAVRTGLGGRRISDPIERGWAFGCAAATVYVIVYAMVHFPLAEVNTVFLLALVWGVGMRVTSTESWRVRWRSRPDEHRPVTQGGAG